MMRSKRVPGVWPLTRTQRRTKVTKADTKASRGVSPAERRREPPGRCVSQVCPQLRIAVFLCVLCSPLCPCPPPASREGFHDLFCFEALSGEVTVQPLEFLVVLDRVAPSQAFVERGVDGRAVVDRFEDFIDRTLRRRLVDAGLLDLQLHPNPAAPVDAGF